MPDAWAEHVALEMAIGEGLVLQAFYAMIDTIDHEEITAILRRGVKQEERHVEFGERRTMEAIKGKPWLKRRLLGQALVTLFAVGRLESFMKRSLPKDHPVMQKLPDFVRHSVAMAELRLLRIGLLDAPLASLSTATKLALVAEAYGGKAVESAARKPFDMLLAPLRAVGYFRPKRLTDTYLDDPLVKQHLIKAQTEGEANEGEEPRPSPQGGFGSVGRKASLSN
jgi:hypothetical protein